MCLLKRILRLIICVMGTCGTLSDMPVTDPGAVRNASILEDDTATTDNHDQLFRKLNEYKAVNLYQQSVLHRAICAGDIRLAEEICNNIPELLNHIGPGGATPINAAICRGDPKMVALLLSYNAIDLSIPDAEGNTPLMNALIKGDEIIIHTLMKVIRDSKIRYGLVNHCNHQGYTPLMMAILHAQNSKIPDDVLRAGAWIHVKSKDGMTPLFAAALKGDKDLFIRLLDKGASIRVSEYPGRTALQFAVMGGSEDILNIIIAMNIDINETSGVGTALHVAVRRENWDFANRLMDMGARVDLQDNQGRTPLQVATRDNKALFSKQMLEAFSNIADEGDADLETLIKMDRHYRDKGSKISDEKHKVILRMLEKAVKGHTNRRPNGA